MPVLESVSDYAGLLQTCALLKELFAEDLRQLAREGDLPSLRAFMSAELIPIAIWNRLPGDWLPSVFEAAPFELLEPLTREWVYPRLLHNAGFAKGCFSDQWAKCLAQSIARAQGDPALMGLCESMLPLALDETCAAGEELNEVLGRAIGRASPADFERLLLSAAELIDAQESSHLPVFFSRLSGLFRDAYARYDALEPSDPAAAQALRSRADQHAGVFLRWGAGVDLTNSDYPRATRLVKNSATFCSREAVAPFLAALWIANGAPGGFSFSAKDLELADCSTLGARAYPDQGVYLWDWRAHISALWPGARLGPVEQALFTGAEGAARALIQAGAQLDDENLRSICVCFQHPDCPLAPSAARAWALCERLRLEQAAPPAPASPCSARL